MKIDYWILTLFAAMALYSCGEGEVADESGADEKIEERRVLDNEDIKRHVEAQLKILPTENYDIQILEEHLDTDDSIDRVITVNLLERAIKDAESKNRAEYRSRMGYTGQFNYIFYIDGKSQTITSGIPVPSSPHFKLQVSFDYVTSPTHKDLVVDFRVRRSEFRQYYTIRERVPIQVSETELFFNLGDDAYETFFVELEEIPGQPWKAIAVYKGVSKNEKIDKLEDSYSVDPKITKGEDLVRRWYFSEKHLKYYVRNDEL